VVYYYDVYYHGLDIIEVSRINMALHCWGERFLKRVYTKAEVDFCRNRAPELAARFAAKEAVLKALREGGISWQEVEVIPNQNGAPVVHLYGKAKARAEELGIEELTITLSHTKEYAVASVVGGS
jgi:holo-[acyl-carrier protein] synthase